MNVQRWAEGFRGGGVRAVDGEWVTYADHVAALAEARASAVEELDGVLVISVEECDRRVAEAEQRVRDEERSHFQEAVWTFDRGYRQGRAEARRQAREAVVAECIAHHGYTPGQTCPYCTDAIAAIAALKGEQT